MTFDLAVIGGGPAGCAAAIMAARSGARVLVLERGRFPKHKVCGEFVSAESLGLLCTLLGEDSQTLFKNAPLIPQARIFLDGKTLIGSISPPAATITRFALDHALWMACRANRVEACSETTAQKIDGRSPFRITTNAETFEADAVINAAGRWSNFTSAETRSRLNGARWIGLKGHFHEAAPLPSVDLYFFDGGYCGVTPVRMAENGSGNVVNACAMVRADVARTMADVFSKSPALLQRSSAWSAATDPVSTSPLVFHDPEPLQNPMLQVGDAASFVDPFVGDGISLALRSGVLAAECLLPYFRKQCSLDQASARFALEYKRQLSHVFRASSRLRGFLQWPEVVRRPVLSLFARSSFVTNRIVKMTR